MTLGLRKLRQIAPNAVNGTAYDPYTHRIHAVYGIVYGAAYGGVTRGATRGPSDPTLSVDMVSNKTGPGGPHSGSRRHGPQGKNARFPIEGKALLACFRSWLRAIDRMHGKDTTPESVLVSDGVGRMRMHQVLRCSISGA